MNKELSFEEKVKLSNYCNNKCEKLSKIINELLNKRGRNYTEDMAYMKQIDRLIKEKEEFWIPRIKQV